MPNITEQKAIKFVKAYLKRDGFTNIQNVEHNRQHNGYDLIATKSKQRIKIEVKGCTRPWGIPDPYSTEFDNKKRLVADFMYVVYLLGKSKPKLCIIPRRAFKPEFIKPKFGYRISSGFKNQSQLEKYLV